MNGSLEYLTAERGGEDATDVKCLFRDSNGREDGLAFMWEVLEDRDSEQEAENASMKVFVVSVVSGVYSPSMF